ncbi:methyltransferase domain-containing protein [Micromonospora sp. CPCC 205546]|uniref:class I SAM-dependent methyltransferase n=1 Tax=Micromonospora sp. CPCC 205546 TaxID=3122397 RepID=UPI002FF27B41
MTGVFGDVADLYDDARPDYPSALADLIRDYHGGTPAAVTEIGAGTGKGTAVLLRLGAPVTCVEPDPRMTARLTATFPQIHPVTDTFEQWQPPTRGVPLLACALAWHWLDPATRNPRAHDALTPGGTLAVFGHEYGYADPEHARAVDTTLRGVDPTATRRRTDWFHQDITDSGLFTDVRAHTLHRDLTLTTDGYLRLLRTFGPYRQRTAAQQTRAATAMRALVDGFGGSVVLRLRTTLVLARRPRTRRP